MAESEGQRKVQAKSALRALAVGVFQRTQSTWHLSQGRLMLMPWNFSLCEQPVLLSYCCNQCPMFKLKCLSTARSHIRRQYRSKRPGRGAKAFPQSSAKIPPNSTDNLSGIVNPTGTKFGTAPVPQSSAKIMPKFCHAYLCWTPVFSWECRFGVMPRTLWQACAGNAKKHLSRVSMWPVV